MRCGWIVIGGPPTHTDAFFCNVIFWNRSMPTISDQFNFSRCPEEVVLCHEINWKYSHSKLKLLRVLPSIIYSNTLRPARRTSLAQSGYLYHPTLLLVTQSTLQCHIMEPGLEGSQTYNRLEWHRHKFKDSVIILVQIRKAVSQLKVELQFAINFDSFHGLWMSTQVQFLSKNWTLTSAQHMD